MKRKFVILLSIAASFFVYLTYDSLIEDVKKKKQPKFYKSLNYEMRESITRLENIQGFIMDNIHDLPKRSNNMTAHQLCAMNDTCIPAFQKFEAELRAAPRYNLSMCVVQKCLSTVMTSTFCYLRDPEKFLQNNREILRDWKVIRFCMFKNEFRNLRQMFEKYEVDQKSRDMWTNIMIVRDPIERFISGFVDKCYRKPVKEACCNNCRRNLTCFVETEYNLMRQQVQFKAFKKTFEDRHFFPQSWRCNLFGEMKHFKFIKYSSKRGAEKQFINELFEIFKSHNIPQESIDFINKSISSGRTAHSTVNTKATNFIESRLKSSPYLMEYIVKMFYHDFVLFNFTLPF